MEPIRIWKGGQAHQIEAAPDAIHHMLRTTAHVALNEREGCTLAQGAYPLHNVRHQCGRSWLTFWAGLLPAVQEWLKQRGIAVRFIGEGQAVLPPPDLPRLGVDDPDLDLVGMVSRHERALIRCGATVEPARLMAQIARAWPEAKIAITAVRHADVYSMAHELRQFGLAVSVILPGAVPGTVERLVVTTYTGLVQSAQYVGPTFRCFDSHHLDIVIALDALEATGKNPMMFLSQTTRSRLYGFLPVDVEAAPFESDLMTSLFGFEEIVIPRHGRHERRVYIASKAITGGQPLPADLDDLELKRRAIWRHDRRNRAIAAMATAIRDGDRTRLQELCPAAWAALANVQTPPVVCVATDNVEHALALHRRLPGWEIRTGLSLGLRGLRKCDRRVLLAGRSPCNCWEEPCIVTLAGTDQADIADIDVLIRADGGMDLPPIAREQLVQAQADRRPLLILDVQDRHHPVLRRWSAKRRKAYESRGWFSVLVEPAQGRINQFLAQPFREARA
jgi:hypothetical protein